MLKYYLKSNLIKIILRKQKNKLYFYIMYKNQNYFKYFAI